FARCGANLLERANRQCAQAEGDTLCRSRSRSLNLAMRMNEAGETGWRDGERDRDRLTEDSDRVGAFRNVHHDPLAKLDIQQIRPICADRHLVIGTVIEELEEEARDATSRQLS